MIINRISEKYKGLPIQVKASLWFLICSFVQKGISALFTPILIRVISTEDFGQFGVFNSWLSIITILVTLNISSGVHSQGIVKYSDQRERFTSSLQSLTTLLVFVWLVVYLFFRKTLNNFLSLNTIQGIAMMAIIWSTAIFGFWSNEKRLVNSYKSLVSVSIIIAILSPIFELILVFTIKEKVTAIVVGSAIISLLFSFVIFVNQMIRGKTFASLFFWKYALTFNLPLIPHYLSQMVLNSADRIMIKDIAGESESGVYNFAYSISMIMLAFGMAISQTLSPWIYQKIKEKREEEIGSIAYLSLVLVSALNLFLILFAPDIIRIFATEDYYMAIWVVPPVAMSVVFIFSYDLFAKFAFYYEKSVLIMMVSVVGALLNVGLNFYFITRFGFIAAAYTTLICYIVYDILHYFLMTMICKRYCDGKKPYNISYLLTIYGSFVLLGFALVLTYNSNIIRYCLIIFCLLIIVLFRNKIYRMIKHILHPNEKYRFK